MKTLLAILFALSVAFAGCIEGPKVLQGKVVRFDEGAKVLVVEDELPPNQEVTFSLEKAELGGRPSTGEAVRIAYREEGGRFMASRVMALAKKEGEK